MAIQFARTRYISRRTGGSAVRSAAYNGRDAIKAERTGELFYFKHRDAPAHHEVLLPAGANEKFRTASVLWNAAEAAEKRSDAQVAREIVLALPADAGIDAEDRIELARSFAEEHFVSKGLAVQLDLHAPHEGNPDSESANWHAHLLITTRRLEIDRFAAKKARDLDPEIRRAGGRALVADGAAWGALWREHQDRYFEAHGLELRVDATAHRAGQHIGPVRMRRAESAAVERAETLRQSNEDAARDPEKVLTALTRNNATFTERDVDRYLAKHLDSESERGAVRTLLFERQDIIPLHDRATGAACGRFTTEAVRAQEKAALADGDALAKGLSRPVDRVAMARVERERGLHADQRAAFAHALDNRKLSIIEGRAGTGKSFTLGAVREVYERSGYRVVGLAPTNAVAQNLTYDGFKEARTVHSALFALKNGWTSWDQHTVIVVDEAAMLDSRVTGELLAAVREAGGKLILAGDDRQLGSIERGGLFAELRQAHGSAEITDVLRQCVHWQREAARDLAEGRFKDALTSFDAAGAIHWTDSQDKARAALVEAWTRDTAREPDKTRFVFAYTNKDVDALNADLRWALIERGELNGKEIRCETKHGEASFAVGDRVQFTATDKTLNIHNGNTGTITGLNARTGALTAKLDSGREVSWSAARFDGFRHGYAGTIYKGQGKTLDQTYLYHSSHWRAASSYVALTRQRESAQVFVARETAGNVDELARQMGRSDTKAASVAWATREEIAERTAARAQAVEAERGSKAVEAPDAAAYWRAIWEKQAADKAALEQRKALEQADDRTVQEAADGDYVGFGYQQRKMTIEDAARLVSPDYAKVAKAHDALEEDAKRLDRSIAHYADQHARWQKEGEARWGRMGMLRQYGNHFGIIRSREIRQVDDGLRSACEQLEPLRERRAALAEELEKSGQDKAALFKRVEPEAKDELRHRQMIGDAAREILQDRREKRFAKEQEQRRERDRDQGLDLGR